ncbi:MAG: HAMP domain-containing sensor histidine kinase [Candidatus Neomarinimicrobiota bacterium]
MNLRPRILSLVIGILVVSFLALAVPLYWYTRGALEEGMDRRLVTVAQIAANQLRPDLLVNLGREPALATVRAMLEHDLTEFLIDGIEGVAIYSRSGDELASSMSATDQQPDIGTVLQTFVDLDLPAAQAVSELYPLAGGGFLKAAAVPINADPDVPLILIVWGGARYVAAVDQIMGSLFWMVLVSAVVAVGLAVVFSRSLLRPVMALSAYARSIQDNIHTATVDLGRTDELGALNQALLEMHTEIRQQEGSMKQLLSGIAHEIKNPLGGMELYAGLLEEALAGEHDGQSDSRQAYLKKVTGELRRLKQIVMEYLDYAKPLRNKLEPIRIEQIIEDVLPILQPEISNKQAACRVRGQGLALGDESKLRRVFVHLLKNSLQALEPQGLIDIDIQRQDSGVQVVVSDDGRGIPSDDLERIFDPYFTTHDKGYGLGLAIVKNIIDEMNGTIIVESEAGEGTKVTLRLP